MNTKIILLLLTTFLIMSCNGTKTSTQAFDRNAQPKPGPAPKVQLGKPKTFVLENGMKVLVVENHKLPKVSVSLNIDNYPIFEGEKAGVSGILGNLLGSGTKNMSKDAFNERIDFLGASVYYNSLGANMSTLSKFFPEVFGLMADGALHPIFTEEEFAKSKAKTIDGIKSGEKSVENISNRVEKVLAYGNNHPFGEFAKISFIENLKLNDVQHLYDTYYKPNNAYLVVIGDVKFEEVKALVEKHFAKWEKGTLPTYKLPETKNVAATEINFIDMPEASQTQVNIVSTIQLDMNDPDYQAVLVANQIFGGDFNSNLNMNLREAHGYTYGAKSSLPANKYVSLFRAGAKVGNQVADAVVIEIMKELNKMYTEKVSEKALKTVKASYAGNFVMEVQKPETVARYALNIEKFKLPANYYETFLEKINAVTADDVMRVSQKYFNKDNTRIVVTSKGSEVLPALEKLGYKINYFDKEGNPTSKPKALGTISSDLTPEKVLDNYFIAIGGKNKLLALKTLEQIYVFNIQGMGVEQIMKFANPNKMNIETKVGGQPYTKIVFDGTNGYMSQMGSKMPLPKEMLAEFTAKKGILDELYLTETSQLKLDGITQANGTACFKMLVDNNGTKLIKYFDVKTGLLMKEEKFVKAPDGSDVTIYTDFFDYKSVDGILFAQRVITNALGIEAEMNVKSVLVNPSFAEDTFK